MINVEYIDHMGMDLSVVNAARVSFHKTSKELVKNDISLIQYLARGMSKAERDKILQEALAANDRETLLDCFERLDADPHWSPFAHTCVSLRVKAPIFVARQLGKHQIGLVWNEVSRRYVDGEPEFYETKGLRKRAENVKQGSSAEYIGNGEAHRIEILNTVRLHHDMSLNYYRWLLDEGASPEQARMYLPQSMMTEWIWTGSMLAFARVCRQRLNPHSQGYPDKTETYAVAKMIEDIVEPLFPVSWKALKRYQVGDE